MSRDKQIEELSKDIFEHCSAGLFEDEAEEIARFVIEGQGYRKASEVAREIFEEIDAHFDQRIALYQTMKSRALLVGNEVERKYADTMIINLTIYKKEIAELKKKYTESEN